MTTKTYTPRQVAKLTGLSYLTVVRKCRESNIPGVYQDEKNKRWYIPADSVRYFRDDRETDSMQEQSVKELAEAPSMILDFEESIKILDRYMNINSTKDPLRFRNITATLVYAASNLGRVFNLLSRCELQKTLTPDGYYQISLSQNELVPLSVLVHVLVAILWCPNMRRLAEVHHINGIKTDNRAVNLIWLKHAEHVVAHRLMRSDQKAYKAYIAEKQQENSWNGEYRPIFFEHVNGTSVVYTTKEAYEDLMSGKRTADEILYDEILYDVFVTKKGENR